MRYLGNKESITSEIFSLLESKNLLSPELSFFDAFCGTGSVSDFAKNIYNDIIINDSLTWATIYTMGRLYRNSCSFEKLGFDPFNYFNNKTEIEEGFIYNNYSLANSNRMYFSIYNAGKIDFIRQKIELWKNKDLINNIEYNYLLASLIESVSSVANTAGVYGSFLKHWDSRSLKKMNFIRVIGNESKPNNILGFNDKIENIIDSVECDILYLDPPYTQNQYGTQYHLLETLILNDNPSISKVTGSRPTSTMRSDWSKDIKAHILLNDIICRTRAKYILFSYSSQGIMSKKFIESILKRYGKEETYTCKKIPYKKYRNWKSENRDDNFEYLFFIELKDKNEINFESPLNYMGSKFKIINNIKNLLPKEIENIYDVFGGGFNAGINFNSKNIFYNDINSFVSELIESFRVNDTYKYIKSIKKYICKFDLEEGNKITYNKARDHYNRSSVKDIKLLYTIILYGFHQQVRFNSKFEFNNPSGIRWFNDSILEKFISFSREIKNKNIVFSSVNYPDILMRVGVNDFVYLDPPYKLTQGSYNDGKRGFLGWNDILERELFTYLDNLSLKGIRFALSYVDKNNGISNKELLEWCDSKKYNLIRFNGVKGISGKIREEVLIINYEP